MSDTPEQDVRAFLERWQADHIDGAALLTAIRAACPRRTDDDLRAALRTVALGRPTPASACAAAALCELTGLGDPLQTASAVVHGRGRTPTEPQWFAWIAGYSYHWICSAGLSACYFDFGDRQFADRIRVYEAIGATTAAQVLREADRAFGPAGPPPTLAGRQAAITDELDAHLATASVRFWACGDEIFTRAFLYALDHPADFTVERKR